MNVRRQVPEMAVTVLFMVIFVSKQWSRSPTLAPNVQRAKWCRTDQLARFYWYITAGIMTAGLLGLVVYTCNPLMRVEGGKGWTNHLILIIIFSVRLNYFTANVHL